MTLAHIIGEFMGLVAQGEVEFYNEFSLQHELGIFLRSKLPFCNNPSYFKKGDEYPVEKVSRDDALDYIKKLNHNKGKSFRLPTEAEWEYVCRSGGRSEEYCGGDNIDSLAWYKSNSDKSTHRVGTKLPNGLGIYDMSGNVWELIEDRYRKDSYGRSPRNNPKGSSGRFFMRRGGAWDNGPRDVRSTDRRKIGHGEQHKNIGFRLALSPNQ